MFVAFDGDMNVDVAREIFHSNKDDILSELTEPYIAFKAVEDLREIPECWRGCIPYSADGEDVQVSCDDLVFDTVQELEEKARLEEFNRNQMSFDFYDMKGDEVPL
jgi:hypothetical protein